MATDAHPKPKRPPPAWRVAAQRHLARGAVVGVGLLALLTLLSFTTPWWWPGDRAADLRVQVTIGLAVCATGLALSRHLGAAVGALVLALLNGMLLWPQLGGGLGGALPGWVKPQWLPSAALGEAANGGAPPGLRTPLRVMSTNVWVRNRDFAAVRAAVRLAAPDVAVFVEVTPEWASELGQLRDGWPHQHYVPSGHGNGVLVISHLPYLSASTVRLGGEGPAAEPDAARIVVAPSGHPVEILGLHLSWPMSPRRADYRNRELAGLARYAARTPLPLVVVGDFNLTPNDGHFGRLLADSGLANCATGRGLVTTWPTWLTLAGRQLPGIHIDHCLHSEGVVVEDFRVGPDVGSDHRPIIASLRVPAAVNGSAAVRSTFPR